MLKEQADVIYLNSLFSVFFTIYPLLIRKRFMPSRKTVLAPRGMLGKGALHIKPLKKKLFLLASRVTGIYKNITWHASTDLEKQEVRGDGWLTPGVGSLYPEMDLVYRIK